MAVRALLLAAREPVGVKAFIDGVCLAGTTVARHP